MRIVLSLYPSRCHENGAQSFVREALDARGISAARSLLSVYSIGSTFLVIVLPVEGVWNSWGRFPSNTELEQSCLTELPQLCGCAMCTSGTISANSQSFPSVGTDLSLWCFDVWICPNTRPCIGSLTLAILCLATV